MGLEDKGKVQLFLDKTTADNLKNMFLRKTGTQERSILISPQCKSGEVVINVPYAHFQAER